MRGLSVRAASVLVVMLVTATASGQGWTSPIMVNRPDQAFDAQAVLCCDRNNAIVAVWATNDSSSWLSYATWRDSVWTDEVGVSTPLPGIFARLRPDIAPDASGLVWLVWCNAYESNNSDIAASYWDGAQWTPERQVNLPDSTDVDFAPKVASGGGKVWCVWYGGPTDMSPYSVYASRWNDSQGRWDAETQVSPPDGNHHWWCDVAVDSLGTPHVVWCTYPLYTVFYSYLDGQQWVAPVRVNDTTEFTASPWASPRIVIDRTGMMHLSFTGARAGATRRDIIYCRNDGTGWSPCQMVTRDSLYNEWYADIAADGPDNVWVAWDRQNEGSDQFRVYASMYDGSEWLPETRLDNDSAYRDGSPSLALIHPGFAMCLWEGTTPSSSNSEIYSSMFLTTSFEEEPRRDLAGLAIRRLSSYSGSGIAVSYHIAERAPVSVMLVDRTGRVVIHQNLGQQEAGDHEFNWHQPLASGAYFMRVKAGDWTATRKFISVR